MPVALSKCTKPACDPQVQVRNKMCPGDYPGQPDHYHTMVESYDYIDNDIRICCKTCDAVTGWNKADAPGMPGAGLDYVIKTWNEAHG